MHHSCALRITDQAIHLFWTSLALFVETVYDVIDAGLGGVDKVVARGVLGRQLSARIQIMAQFVLPGPHSLASREGRLLWTSQAGHPITLESIIPLSSTGGVYHNGPKRPWLASPTRYHPN
jgi:hypothetical protein